MCGIVGYIGDREAQAILLKSLSRLEYRGYDSAGIAVLANGEIQCLKSKGKVADLEKKLLEKLKEKFITLWEEN